MTTWLNPLYYVTADTNPTTQVWDVLAGAYVSNTIAAYEAWLNAATPGSGVPQMGGGLVATSDNGSGKLRVQCGDASAIQTGMVLNVVGNVNGAYGAAPVTFVDATHFDVTSIVYPGTPDTGGNIWSAQWIDTFADMMGVIDHFNSGQWLTGGGQLGQNTSTFSSATTIVLTNPLVNTQIIAVSGVFAGLLALTMPKMNIPGSPPVGAQILFISQAFDGVNAHGTNIHAQDGTTLIAGILAPPSSGLNYNPAVLVELTANTSQNGTWLAQQLAQNPWAARFGGTGTTTNPTDAQILVGQSLTPVYAPVTMSGDATISDTGVVTVGTPNGSWTPSDQSGASLTFTSVSVAYSRVGNMVFVYGRLTYPVTADGSTAKIGGLPVTVPNQPYAQNFSVAFTSAVGAPLVGAVTLQNTTNFELVQLTGGAGGTPLTNAQLSGGVVAFNIIYPAT